MVNDIYSLFQVMDGVYIASLRSSKKRTGIKRTCALEGTFFFKDYFLGDDTPLY